MRPPFQLKESCLPCTLSIERESCLPCPHLPPPSQTLAFLAFLWIASRFRYREVRHATAGAEALAVAASTKSAVGVAFIPASATMKGRPVAGFFSLPQAQQ